MVVLPVAFAISATAAAPFGNNAKAPSAESDSSTSTS